MIIGGSKRRVVENMRKAIKEGRFNDKVETGDPDLSAKEKTGQVARYLKNQNSLLYRFLNVCARALVDTGSKVLNWHTEIEGLENLRDLEGGVIVTSNHFNPLDNTAVRITVNRAGYRRLFLVSQDTNLAMRGWIGFIMNHEDIIPMMKSRQYLSGSFEEQIADNLRKGHAILIYPEQEMWFNYRKPRPPKRGAYYYAAKNQVPIVSLFVEVRDLRKKDNDEFRKVRYTVHVLNTIYPNSDKSVRENSILMMNQDYEQKVKAYERAYGKKLSYEFGEDDIAGWISAQRP
ncbi:MAG: 1-acyl-sn-glycerol-3-phosphate acyltransferase [Lachnospiraceae bacterium]|nr:1-acyl-sn-glycerol-3-phosphate acyltransferase [Lachnospiraceae bacterium]